MIRTTPTRSGSAIMLSMILIAAIAGVAASLSSLTIGNQRLRDERWSRLELVYAAESAANLALNEFQNNWDTYAPLFEGQAIGTSVTMPVAAYLGTGTINNDSVTATLTSYADTGSTLAANELVYRIETIAARGSTATPETYRRRRVEMIVYPDPTTIFDNALFAYNGFDFKGSASTDSWDSSLGEWIAGMSTGNGDLGSEGTIIVSNSGVDGDVNDNEEAPDFNFSYAQELADAGPTTYLGTVNSDTTVTEVASPYLLDELDIGNSTTLTVQGEVAIFLEGPLTLNKGTILFDLATDPDSSLIVYQKDFSGVNQMSINGNSTVGAIKDDDNDGNPEIDPSRFIIITEADGDVRFNGNGELAAVIYSPNITYQLNGTFDFYGAVIARAFGTDTGMGRINGTFNFHYDDALGSLDLGIDPRLLISGWRASDLSYNQ